MKMIEYLRYLAHDAQSPVSIKLKRPYARLAASHIPEHAQLRNHSNAHASLNHDNTHSAHFLLVGHILLVDSSSNGLRAVVEQVIM